MRFVLLDLGKTLEVGDVLLPGARQLLDSLIRFREVDRLPFDFALVSDFSLASTPRELFERRQEYYDILETLSIRRDFEPVEKRVTLSDEVGVFKPDARLFRAAIDKLLPGGDFADALFVTESLPHVEAARRLGLTAYHYRGPGQTTGDIAHLEEFIPIVRDFVGEAPRVRVAKIRWDPGNRRSLPPDAWWVQLGDQALVFSDESDRRAGEEKATRRGPALEPMPGAVSPQQLHVVVQKGRLFQQEHPEVPVLLDKGRYLVVELDRRRAEQLTEAEEVCFTIQPLSQNEVIFDVRPSAPAARRAPVDWVLQLLGKLTEQAFKATLTHLVSFPTRHSTGAGLEQAASWARDQLIDWGYGVSMQTITVGADTSLNVIAEKPASTDSNRDLLLVVAHLDSINIFGGASAPAPGADDNGSGSAGLLEIARVLAEVSGDHDLRFILFGGEEQGLHGSRQYLAAMPDEERSRIRMIVNMDMIGSLNTEVPTVLIEGAPVSQTVIDGLALAAADYTNLTVQTSLSAAASDHVPFIQAGLPAVLTIEGADGANSRIHTADDTMDHIDLSLALDILRMNVAFLATVATATPAADTSETREA